jgi:acyl-CoA synthetase (AMP-forming)/AMP-acid ligase II
MHFRKLDNPGGTHELIEKLRGGNRAGLVLFSSGSAGRPKAMIHDLTNLVQIYADRKARNLSMIVFLMFDHIGGINTLFNSLASGSFMVAPVKRDAEEVAVLIQEHKVSILPTSPTFLNLLLIAEAPRRFDLSSLKIITYGTEPMPESLLRKLRETFPKVKFLQTFGTSETGISRTDSKSSTSLYMTLDDPDIEHKVVDGELWLRSKTQILGYLNHSMESFTEDGWFRTGDKVEMDEGGYLRVVGRSKEMINVGGEKVVPSEVESVIMEVNGVKDCTVFGQSSPVTGQIVAAKVLLDEGLDQAVAKSEIRKHCSAKLARYKVPVKIVFVAESLFGDRFKKKRNVTSAD